MSIQTLYTPTDRAAIAGISHVAIFGHVAGKPQMFTARGQAGAPCFYFYLLFSLLCFSTLAIISL